MPITVLDPNTALIVIDLQKGITGLAGALAAPVVANSARLAEAFRAKGLPVVLVHVEPGRRGRTEQTMGGFTLPPDFAELVPELNMQPSDHCITKHSWGAFSGTGLEDWLRQRGVTQVVITGISTSIGVDTTARQAAEAGFNVAVVTDATADREIDAHNHHFSRIFPRLGETGATADILEHLAHS